MQWKTDETGAMLDRRTEAPMNAVHSILIAAILAAPACLSAAPDGWIPEIGGGVEASHVDFDPGDSPDGTCKEPAADHQAKSNCKGKLSWDAKQCKHVCSDKKGKVLEKKPPKPKKPKKAKKKKDDGNSPHEVAGDVDFSCKNPPAATESAKSTCPGSLVWSEKSCKHVCRAPEVDCSGLNSKNCKSKKKKAKQQFNKAMQKSGQAEKKPAKKLKVKTGFGALRDQK